MPVIRNPPLGTRGRYAIAALILLLGRSAFGDPVVLDSGALQLRFEVARGDHGGITLLGVRDRVLHREWLAVPSRMFEFSVRGEVWKSDDLPIFDVTRTESSLTISGRLFKPPQTTTGHPYTLAITSHPADSTIHVTGTFTNADADWFGPFALGDKGALPVFATDAYLSSVRTSDHSEEVFVVGFDGIVYGSREQDDSPWSMPAALYSTSNPALRNVFPSGAPLAAVRRNDRQLDLFAVASRGDLRTVFRLGNNPFSAPISITLENFFAAGTPVAALNLHEETDPARNSVEVYAVQASSGQLFVLHEDDDSGWFGPQLVTLAEPRLGSRVHVAALQRNTRQRDLFLINADGNLLTTFRRPDAIWSGYTNLSATQPGLLPSGGRLAAVNGKGDDEHVFVVGNDRRVYWTHEEQDGPWSALVPITDPLDALPGAGITAVHRTGREIVVAVPLRNGNIAVLSKVHDAAAWTMVPQLRPAKNIADGANLSGMLRRPGLMDLFYVSANDRHLWTSGAGAGDLLLRTVFPKIVFDGAAELRDTLGMVAQEVGAVTPLIPLDQQPGTANCISPDKPRNPSMCRTLGMPYASDDIAQKTGLPEAMNSLEVASVTRGASTLFFADVSGNLEAGKAPIQMTLSSTELAGFWESDVHGGQQIDLPEFAIGVAPGGSWRNAVDFYVNAHRDAWTFADTPQWLREAGAIYTFSAGGAGGIYLDLPGGALAPHSPNPTAGLLPGNLGDYAGWYAPSFETLVPQMLREARGLGTNVVYLWDYWDFTGTCLQDIQDPFRVPYFCKGDYQIRGELGGADALRRGVAAVHAGTDGGSAGRVILYVEPFLLGAGANVFNQYRYLWGARSDNGSGGPFVPFGGGDPSLAMSQAMRYWQDRVVDIATRLIRDTGADGIFLDSGGWRMNLRLDTEQEVVRHSALEHAQGYLELADRVRREIRKINPEAVVLTETAAGPIGRHVDGGISADLHGASPAFTGAETVKGALIASPVRYGVPQINFFSNGRSLSQMNQVFAAGQSLALSSNWFGSTRFGIPPDKTNFMRSSAPYIKRLVQARTIYANALVHGQQFDQPTTQVDAEGWRPIVAYGYAGSQAKVITVVNKDTETVLVGLNESPVLHQGDAFCDVVSGEQFVASTLPLIMVIPPAQDVCAAGDGTYRQVCGLRVLYRMGINEGCN